MPRQKEINLFIVEDDAVQAQVLLDKLTEIDSRYNIKTFESGLSLINYLNGNYTPLKRQYLVLDYFLQTQSNPNALNGYEIIKKLAIEYPNVSIALFSAFKSDGETKFKNIVNEKNVIGFVQKSNYAYAELENKIRFDIAQYTLNRKKSRLKIASFIFMGLCTLAAAHFLFSYLAG